MGIANGAGGVEIGGSGRGISCVRQCRAAAPGSDGSCLISLHRCVAWRLAAAGGLSAAAPRARRQIPCSVSRGQGAHARALRHRPPSPSARSPAAPSPSGRCPEALASPWLPLVCPGARGSCAGEPFCCCLPLRLQGLRVAPIFKPPASLSSKLASCAQEGCGGRGRAVLSQIVPFATRGAQTGPEVDAVCRGALRHRGKSQPHAHDSSARRPLRPLPSAAHRAAPPSIAVLIPCSGCSLPALLCRSRRPGPRPWLHAYSAWAGVPAWGPIGQSISGQIIHTWHGAPPLPAGGDSSAAQQPLAVSTAVYRGQRPRDLKGAHTWHTRHTLPLPCKRCRRCDAGGSKRGGVSIT